MRTSATDLARGVVCVSVFVQKRMNRSRWCRLERESCGPQNVRCMGSMELLSGRWAQHPSLPLHEGLIQSWRMLTSTIGFNQYHVVRASRSSYTAKDVRLLWLLVTAVWKYRNNRKPHRSAFSKLTDGFPRYQDGAKCKIYQGQAEGNDNKKAVQSQRWPRDAPTKVDKQTATPPPKITWLPIDSIQPDVRDAGVQRTFLPKISPCSPGSRLRRAKMLG